MSYIQKVTKIQLDTAAIKKVVRKEDITIHYPGNDAELTGTCYIEFKGENHLIMLASPCPFNP